MTIFLNYKFEQYVTLKKCTKARQFWKNSLKIIMKNVQKNWPNYYNLVLSDYRS